MYEDVKRSIKFQFNNDIEEESQFVQQLPQDLKVTVSLFLYNNLIERISFLNEKPMVFIAWMCPRLKPMVQNDDQYIFMDDDEVSCIYFMINGNAGYVLPKHQNIMYIEFSEGCHFGIIDIVSYFVENDHLDHQNWIQH